jgi:hypothetical protein
MQNVVYDIKDGTQTEKFGEKVMRRIFGPMRNEEKRGWKVAQ